MLSLRYSMSLVIFVILQMLQKISCFTAPPTREALRGIFDEVRLVDVMDSGDSAHLALMKRPDLGVTFTKLHCWTLTRYSKCVFMDADTMVSAKRTVHRWRCGFMTVIWCLSLGDLCSHDFIFPTPCLMLNICSSLKAFFSHRCCRM